MSRYVPCAVCGKTMWRNPETISPTSTCNPCRRLKPKHVPSIETYACQACGVDVQRMPTKGQRPKWCVACRAKGYKAPRTCPRCSVEFLADGRTVYCSQWCYSQTRVKPKHQALVHIGPVPHPTHVPVATTSGRTWTAGSCAWCADPFVIIDQTTARYCSTRCGKQAGKARHGRFLISQRARVAIYERDEWTCQICSEPVDRDAHYLNDWAPTLDHIECQSWVLVPDHSAANLRLAHRWCNSVRGDETRWTAADLAA